MLKNVWIYIITIGYIKISLHKLSKNNFHKLAMAKIGERVK